MAGKTAEVTGVNNDHSLIVVTPANRTITVAPGAPEYDKFVALVQARLSEVGVEISDPEQALQAFQNLAAVWRAAGNTGQGREAIETAHERITALVVANLQTAIQDNRPLTTHEKLFLDVSTGIATHRMLANISPTGDPVDAAHELASIGVALAEKKAMERAHEFSLIGRIPAAILGGAIDSLVDHATSALSRGMINLSRGVHTGLPQVTHGVGVAAGKLWSGLRKGSHYSPPAPRTRRSK